MYNGYEIEAGSRQKLFDLFPPKYPNVIGDHITHTLGVNNGELPPEVDKVLVVGYIDNGENVEGFLVSINGTTKRPSGGQFHITWSIDRSNGGKPVHTNNYTKDAKKIARPIPIDVDPKYWD